MIHVNSQTVNKIVHLGIISQPINNSIRILGYCFCTLNLCFHPLILSCVSYGSLGCMCPALLLEERTDRRMEDGRMDRKDELDRWMDELEGQTRPGDYMDGPDRRIGWAGQAGRTFGTCLEDSEHRLEFV